MKYSEFIWEEFIYGGHWLSIGAAAIALSTMMILNLQIKWEFLLIVYLGTQCIYNYNHYKELKVDKLSNSSRVNHLRKYQQSIPQLIAVYGICFLALLSFYGDRTSFLFGGGLLFLGLFFTYKGKRISKKIVAFKSIYASLSWALLVLFTVNYCSFSLDISVLFVFIFVFLRFLVSTNFFDIKDIRSDRFEGLLTLPTTFQNKHIGLIFLHILNFISFIPILIGVFIGDLPPYSLFLILLFFYSLFYIQKVKSKKTDILSLSYVIVDGEFIFWPFFLVIGLIFTSLNLLW